MNIRDMCCCDCLRPFLWKKEAVVVPVSEEYSKIVCLKCSENYLPKEA